MESNKNLTPKKAVEKVVKQNNKRLLKKYEEEAEQKRKEAEGKRKLKEMEDVGKDQMSSPGA